MPRYENTLLGISEKGLTRNKRKFLTTIYDNVEHEETDVFVITQEGDRLDNLANQFYNDPTLWWYIAQANNLFSPHLEPNTSLRIPVDLAYADLEK